MIFEILITRLRPGKKVCNNRTEWKRKNTLLQVIAANMQLSEGAVEYDKSGLSFLKESSRISEYFHSEIPLLPLYPEIVEEMTAIEFLSFIFSFKPLSRL